MKPNIQAQKKRGETNKNSDYGNQPLISMDACQKNVRFLCFSSDISSQPSNKKRGLKQKQNKHGQVYQPIPTEMHMYGCNILSYIGS